MCTLATRPGDARADRHHVGGDLRVVGVLLARGQGRVAADGGERSPATTMRHDE